MQGKGPPHDGRAEGTPSEVAHVLNSNKSASLPGRPWTCNLTENQAVDTLLVISCSLSKKQKNQTPIYNSKQNIHDSKQNQTIYKTQNKIYIAKSEIITKFADRQLRK